MDGDNRKQNRRSESREGIEKASLQSPSISQHCRLDSLSDSFNLVNNVPFPEETEKALQPTKTDLMKAWTVAGWDPFSSGPKAESFLSSRSEDFSERSEKS
jgi:hypothetical protein